MTEGLPTVYVIDDDPSVRRAIERLLVSVGLQVTVMASPQEFLHSKHPNVPSCLVVDIRLAGTSGLDFQKTLAVQNIHIPIVFVTAHGDIGMAVRAMKAGAVDFFTKPFREQDLLDAIHAGLDRDRVRRRRAAEDVVVRELIASLTDREREVIDLVLTGMLNKEVAAKVGITENTVKAHRGHAMEKMRARSLPDLVRLFDKLESK